MTFDEETLMAFADGELDAAMASRVAAAIAEDPAIARRIQAFRLQRQQVGAAFEGVLHETVPPALRAAAQGISRIKRVRRWASPELGAMAAGVLVGVMATWGVLRSTGEPLIDAGGDGLVARGELARSLTEHLASDERAGSIQVGLSFRDRSGAYCRTFVVTDDAVAGLACRGPDVWSVKVATTATGQRDAASYRMAAGSLPAEILGAVQSRIAGDPLDATAEAVARESGWARGDASPTTAPPEPPDPDRANP